MATTPINCRYEPAKSFPVRVFVKWSHLDGKEWYWRSICVVDDNESLGWLERALVGTALKIEEVNSPEDRAARMAAKITQK